MNRGEELLSDPSLVSVARAGGKLWREDWADMDDAHFVLNGCPNYDRWTVGFCGYWYSGSVHDVSRRLTTGTLHPGAG